MPGDSISDNVHRVLDAMIAFAETVRDTASSGIRHVVNIGIGGSDLGAQMVVPALDAFVRPGIQFHCVSNVDGHDIAPVLRKLKPADTLFIVASKTFTTQETMANAQAAKAWFLANGLAQSQALMVGKSTAQALTEKAPTASKTIDAQTLARHRSFPGNRPSTTLLLDRLTPRSLGALIAMYEHRVFTSGALWGINSYDQWGVELGKALCADLLPRFAPDRDLDGLDGSTAGLLQRLRSNR